MKFTLSCSRYGLCDDLKALIDQLPEPEIEMARQILENYLHPPSPRPEVERMQRRFRAYRDVVEQRFRATRKPGTIGGMSGGGHFSEHAGVPHGGTQFHYWDDKALVHQSLQHFDGQESELMERLSFSPDRTKLQCSLEIASGGHTVNYTEEFPITKLATG
jgi:hypothetical protein